MFTSDNQTLRSLSCMLIGLYVIALLLLVVYNGILSPLQSVGRIKESISSTFAQSVVF